MKSFYLTPNIRLILLIFLGGLVTTSQVMAAACSTTVSPHASDCDGSNVIWTSGPLVINQGVTLSDTGNLIVRNSSNSFTNNGTIVNSRGGDTALVTGGSVVSVTNNGSISGSHAAIQNDNSGVIGTLTNNGTLTGRDDYAILNSGVITNLINTNQITGGVGPGIYNSSIGTISTITNTGIITGGIQNDSMMGMKF
jgi:hypothetical protein